MRTTSKLRKALFGGVVLLMVFAVIGIGFYGNVVAGSTNAIATRGSAGTAQPGGQGAGRPIAPTVQSYMGGAIAIPDGIASPYPSAVVVAASTTATITKATVTITQFSHTTPGDVDMLLVGPTGAKISFWSDCGGTSVPTVNATITLDDMAGALMTNVGPMPSGTFRPTNLGTGDTWPTPGPCTVACDADAAATAGTATFANRFNGTNPNGTWNLFIRDDGGGDMGSIGSWSLNLTFGPTLARMSGGSAIVDDDGLVELKWQTGLEVDNLGFNIYREEGGERTLVNKHIIAGSALIAGQGTAMTAGRNYRFRDTAAKPGQAAQYWIEAKDLNGSTLLSGPFIPTYSPGRLDPQPPSSSLGDLGHGGSGKVKLSSMSVQAAPPGQTAFKLGVKQSGYYRVNQTELITAGFSQSIDPRNLQLFEDGTERPIIVQGEQDGRLDSGDWIEFYGRAPDKPYTDVHVYRLIAGSQPGLRIKRPSGKSATSGALSFLYTAELKERNIYFSGLKNGEQENFFGAVLARDPVVRNLALRNVAASAPASATLEVAMQGVTNVPHDVQVIFNEADVGAVTFDGQSPGIARISVPQSSLREGNNSVQLIARGGETDVSLVNAIRLSYWHTYQADYNALQFTAGAAQLVTVSGFTNSAVRVLDLSDAGTGGVQELVGAVRRDSKGYSVTVTIPGAGVRTLLAFASDQVKKPSVIAADIASSWRDPKNGADLIIFTRRDFISALDPLKAQRQSQGYKVSVVDIEDVYDEFNYGNKSPQAIRDFLAYATTSWKIKPRFALFAGDASFDPKNYLGAGDWDIIPTKLIDTKYLETASDDWSVDFNGDGLPEMAVGRLPARTAGEMAVLVGKIVGYDKSNPADTMLLVADSNDEFDFEAATAALRPFIPGNLKAIEIYRGSMDDATARALLLGFLNQGQRVVNYLGHGNLDVLRGGILTSDDASSLTNRERLSLLVSMTCLSGYFQDATVESLAEALVNAQKGGAIAAWASTGMCAPEEQAVLNQEFYRLLFGGGSLTIGEAAVRAKSSVTDEDVRRTWVLIGDPTTRLR